MTNIPVEDNSEFVEAGKPETPKHKVYENLESFEDYDHAKVEDLAGAMTELRQLKKREAYLVELITDNQPLADYIWGTADGKLIPHHLIADDHFKNILTHIVKNGGMISKPLKAEAHRRGMELPDEYEVLTNNMNRMLTAAEGEIIDHNRDLDD